MDRWSNGLPAWGPALAIACALAALAAISATSADEALAPVELGGASEEDPAPARSAPTPNLLLIVADTLRGDALACYGGEAAAPNICGLASRGVMFEFAYSSAARTLPASVAMFTGNHAPGYARVPRAAEGASERGAYFYVLDDERLLPERLRDRGYDAVADVENPVAEQSNNLQGFRRLPLPDFGARSAVAAALGADTSDPRYRRALALAHYLLAADRAPFFALRWIEDPHAAYAPPPHLRNLDAAELPRPVSFYASLDPRALRERVGSLAPAEVGVLRRLYLREVESVDERVGTTLRALERSGQADRTFVVFTSDHGEGFGEHGRFQHGNSFYEELVRIPLIVAGPGLPAGRRLAARVSHVDLAPSLAELLGLDPPSDVQGKSFASLLRGTASPSPKRISYLADAFRWRKRDALIEGRYKLISWGPRTELYDLSRDPGEQRDLATEQPEVVARMRERMQAIRADNEARRRRNLAFDDPQVLRRTREATREQLRALGYID